MSENYEVGRNYTYTGSDSQVALRGKTGVLTQKLGDIGIIVLPETGEWTVKLRNLTPAS